MKNVLIGWLIALTSISISVGSVFYHQSEKKNSNEKKCTSVKVGKPSVICAKSKICPPRKKCSPCPAVVQANKVPVGSKDIAPIKSKDATVLKSGDPLKPVMAIDVMVETPLKKEKKSILIYFKRNSLRISKENADNIIEIAKSLPDFKYKIGVRTGDKKTKTANRTFAKKRARRIRKILVKAGISLKKISYRVFPGNPEKSPDTDFKSRYWRRGRVTAIPGGK